MFKTWKQWGRALCLAAALTVAGAGAGPVRPQEVYGAESSIIEKLTVTVKTNYGEPEEILDPEITVNGTGCSVGEIRFGTAYDKWKPGKKVRIEINVNADEGKYFPVSLNRSECKVNGANFVSAKALDKTTLQVKVDFIPVTVLGETDKAGWSKGSKTKAVWGKVNYATGYTVSLYGDDKLVKRLNVETNSADLSQYMKDMEKIYYYEVKAIPRTSDERKYLKEGRFVTSTDQEFEWEDYEEVRKNNSDDGGSIKGENYVLPDGEKVKNSWRKISGKWYYFDESGNRAKGWFNYGGSWYYMNSDGAMQTGWLDAGGGVWYYLGTDGKMQTGWAQGNPGVWYYLDSSGRMARGLTNVDGIWYYMDDSGKMQTGWIDGGGGIWYYFHPDGSMAQGWTNINGTWYYMDVNGHMMVNMVIDGWVIGADGIARPQ